MEAAFVSIIPTVCSSLLPALSVMRTGISLGGSSSINLFTEGMRWIMSRLRRKKLEMACFREPRLSASVSLGTMSSPWYTNAGR